MNGSTSKEQSAFRCCEMCMCEIFFPQEMVFDCLAHLGEIGIAQFIDLNASQKSFQRRFVGYVRSCADMERRLRFIEKEIRREGIKPVKLTMSPPVPKPEELEAMMTTAQKLESELVELINTIKNLHAKSLHYIHMSYVLDKTAQILLPDWSRKSSVVMISKSTQTSQELPLNSEFEHLQNVPLPTILRDIIGKEDYYIDERGLKVEIYAGIIMKQRVPAFQLMLWRIGRGNIFVVVKDIEAPTFKSKCVFLITFQGEKFKEKVWKICEGFNAKRYPCPIDEPDRRKLINEVDVYLHDSDSVLQKSTRHRSLLLLAASRKLEYWYLSLWKVKGIYHTMNMFDSNLSSRCLVARAWIPEHRVKELEDCVYAVANSHNGAKPVVLKINTRLRPPAYNYINKYTKAFQVIVDAYGVNSYGEVNPAPFTVITFPFIFSLMFGDVGHGLIITVLASAMVLMEKYLENKHFGEIMAILFAGRYIILLMGIFSVYAGFLYNDCFGIGFNIFSPSWRVNFSGVNIMRTETVSLDPETDLKRAHPFGIDLIWQMSSNEINFTNSLKMKMSIIFGVVHMLFGICISLWNYVHLKKYINIIALYVPQVLLLSVIFLYMVLLIFYKWIAYGPHRTVKSIHCAPSILNTIISMMLMSSAKAPENCETNMYPHQSEVQPMLLLIAFICIPWMLLVKPLYILYKGTEKPESVQSVQPSRSITRSTTLIVTTPSLVTQPSWVEPEEISDEEEDNFLEVFINQGIHTIEFVLGTISHTASYLRLWALSLAHSQLTEVLLTMVLNQGLQSDTYMALDVVMLCFIFFIWAILTFAILVIMEGLSAFLHTLRLHWVEFQSKFYEGLGYPFVPFRFKTIILESKYKGNQQA